MKKAIFLLAAIAAFVSCSKGGGDDNPTPPSSLKVTKAYLENIGSANNNPNQVQLFNGATTIGTFKVAAGGTIKIEYRGLGGRSMLQGSARHVVSSGTLADWAMNDNDTIRITDNGVVSNYVTSSSAGINGGYYTTVNPGENEAAVFTRINAFASSVGALASLTFKK